MGVLGLDQAKYADVTDLEFPTAQISDPLSFLRAIIYFLAAPLPFNDQTTVMRITGLSLCFEFVYCHNVDEKRLFSKFSYLSSHIDD